MKSDYSNCGSHKKLTLQIPTDQFRSLPIPAGSAKVGHCFVRVCDIPQDLDDYMQVNPRVPDRKRNGTLAGPVVKGILKTLYESPEEMALKNQGIYILAEHIDFSRVSGGVGKVSIVLSDRAKHGIVNGGHTYAAICEATQNASDDELESLKNAYVRLHLFEGIDSDIVPQIAEGLNRSKQVDNPSLENLKGTFDKIKEAMQNNPARNLIAYRQGDDGEIEVSEILTYLAFFNTEKFSDKKHPHQYYKRPAAALEMFGKDQHLPESQIHALISKLPDILWLADSIRKNTPDSSKRNGYNFGRMKKDKNGKERMGNDKHKGRIKLPFLNEMMDYPVPNGWVYPVLAAFRANIKWDKEKNQIEWKVKKEIILKDVIDDLIGICVTEKTNNDARPEIVGGRESVYRQCYDKVQLYLAKKGLL